MKVTHRWKDFMLIGMQMHDLFEIDGKNYVCMLHWFPDDVIIVMIQDRDIELFTFAQLKEKKGSHPNLKAMYDAALYRNLPCECGAEKVKTPHSTWCPKYVSKAR